MFELGTVAYIAFAGAAVGDGRAADELAALAAVDIRDASAAVRWLERAAQRGHLAAMQHLAMCHERGAGVRLDAAAAAALYFRAAVLGCAEAQNALAICYMSGKGVTKNGGIAYRWFHQAATAGCVRAQFNLALCLERERRWAEAIHWYSVAAERDHAGAQTNLAALYEAGIARLPAASKQTARITAAQAAAALYTKAATRGHREAQYNLALSLDQGSSKHGSKEAAAGWYRRAAENGSAPAMVNLGWLYEHGAGVEKCAAEAARWYARAADLGNPEALANLAVCYLNGDGVEVNPAKAAEFCVRAAKAGNAAAQLLLGLMLEEGVGTQPDPAAAVTWYMLAAQQGVRGAQFNLGSCYADGRGVERDDKEAQKWLEAAKQNTDVVTAGPTKPRRRGTTSRHGSLRHDALDSAQLQSVPPPPLAEADAEAFAVSSAAHCAISVVDNLAQPLAGDADCQLSADDCPGSDSDSGSDDSLTGEDVGVCDPAAAGGAIGALIVAHTRSKRESAARHMSLFGSARPRGIFESAAQSMSGAAKTPTGHLLTGGTRHMSLAVGKPTKPAGGDGRGLVDTAPAVTAVDVAAAPPAGSVPAVVSLAASPSASPSATVARENFVHRLIADCRRFDEGGVTSPGIPSRPLRPLRHRKVRLVDSKPACAAPDARAVGDEPLPAWRCTPVTPETQVNSGMAPTLEEEFRFVYACMRLVAPCRAPRSLTCRVS